MAGNQQFPRGASATMPQLLQNLQDLGAQIHGLSSAIQNLEMEEGKIVMRPGQMEQIREDQVQNNAGGFVFAVSDEIRIRRFLILGTSGGTFYASEKEQTLDNIGALIEIINKGYGHLILTQIREISLAGRNPKQEPIMLALALCARYRVHDTANLGENPAPVLLSYAQYLRKLHAAAFRLVGEVCRIPTHLFMFVDFCEKVSKETNTFGKGKSTGWGRLMRKTIETWYASKSPEQLAMHVTKYKKRNEWSHRDLFRLAHPKPDEHSEGRGNGDRVLEVEQIYRYIVKGDLRTRKRRLSPSDEALEQPQTKYSAVQLDTEENSTALNLIEAYLSLSATTPEADVVKAIKDHGLVREHIPTEHLNSVAVWQALIEKMPMTAMIRNLGKLSAIEALTSEHKAKIVNQLKNDEELRRSRIHPLQVLLAKSVYQSGHGDKGKLTWKVDTEIDMALEKAFYKSFINAPPTNKRICMALDISGSMCVNISNTSLSCRTASAALSLVSLRNEKDVECVGFCEELQELPYKGDWTLQRIEEHMDSLVMGSTDCALPMIWAKEQKKKFDVFIVYTDCETYFGDVHPFEALKQYRESSGILDAKLIVMGMTATNFTIADPTDAGMLDVVGFDSAVPQLIHDFVTGAV